MNRAHFKICIIFALQASINAACGSWAGNPPKSKDKIVEPVNQFPLYSPVAIAVVAQKSNTYDIKDKFGNKLGTISFTKNTQSFNNIRFFKNGQISDTAIRGPLLLDFVQGSSEPDTYSDLIRIGDYDEIRATPSKVEKNGFASLPGQDPMIGFSSHVAGIINVGPLPTPFDIYYNTPVTLSVQKSSTSGSSSTIVANRSNLVSLEIDFSQIFVIDIMDDLLNPAKAKDFWEKKAVFVGTFEIKQ